MVLSAFSLLSSALQNEKIDLLIKGDGNWIKIDG